MALISLNNLERFFNNLKTYISNALNSKANTAHTHTKSEITDFPTIPTVNNATLTIQKNGTTVKTFTANASSNVTANITVPTKTSDLTNDSGFLTSHQDLSGYIPLSGTNALSGSIIPSTNTAYSLGSGSKFFKNIFGYNLYTAFIYNHNNTSQVAVYGGTSYQDGAEMTAYGKDHPYNSGCVYLVARDGTNTKAFIAKPDGTLTWNNKNVAMQEDTVPRSGGAVLTSDTFARNVDNESLVLIGGSAYNLGAYLELRGKNHSGAPGQITLACRKSDGTAVTLDLRPNGAAKWNNKNVAMQEDTVPRAGGAVMKGGFGRTVNDSFMDIYGGTKYRQGAQLTLCGKDYTGNEGMAFLLLVNDSQSKQMTFYPSGTWTWQGQAVQLTSDQRLKQQINAIDDKLLDAWEDVNLVQFKYNDAVKEKSDNARLHTGYVVQQIDEACKSHGVDISEYGLYCHEEYPEETREVEHEDGTKTTEVVRPASEHYSLRYTEALIVECAYLRKCIKELKEEIKELKNK